MILRRFLKKLGALGDPRPWTLEEWSERHREHVRADLDRVLPHIPPDGLFVDIGANVGIFSELVLEQRPRCRAILFEPVRRYYERCVERFAGNPSVRVEHLGLSDVDEERTIYKAKHNYGANSVLREIMFDRRANSMVREDTVVEEETIRCHTFDGYMREHGVEHIDFVKTDTEGFDYVVLRGMLPWLERAEALPVILAELLQQGYHPHWDEQEEVVRRLLALGYEEPDLSHMRKVDDILFLPAASRVEDRPD